MTSPYVRKECDLYKEIRRRKRRKLTSPMPEAAPVMMTTLPATSSVKKNERKLEMNNLGNRKSGRNRHTKIRVKGGATMFKTLCIQSIIFLLSVVFIASSINNKGQLREDEFKLFNNQSEQSLLAP